MLAGEMSIAEAARKERVNQTFSRPNVAVVERVQLGLVGLMRKLGQETQRRTPSSHEQ